LKFNKDGIDTTKVLAALKHFTADLRKPGNIHLFKDPGVVEEIVMVVQSDDLPGGFALRLDVETRRKILDALIGEEMEELLRGWEAFSAEQFTDIEEIAVRVTTGINARALRSLFYDR
jgi:hypothetical protein